MYGYNNEILVTAFQFEQSSWTQNPYFIIKKKCLPWASQIQFNNSLPSESPIAPMSNLIEFGLAHEQ